MSPINICLLLRCLEPIINVICIKFGSEKEALKEVNDIIKIFRANPEDEYIKDYKYEDVSLIDCLKGDYNFLKKKFVIENRFVPDINHYINNYIFPKTTLQYPFSIKDLYDILVERGIYILIHNYFESNNKSK
jgi:hypothetical protein